MSDSFPSTLDNWLIHCEQLHTKTIEMGLERVQKVAHRLNLQLDAPVFTVAGTNGKGSTCAMLESILLAAGYRVGVYSSPHLVDFEERCRINGEMITKDFLLPFFAEVESARLRDEVISLSYFEFTTLVILKALSVSGLDAIVLEVGLGGRLDAVNIIDADCAIITSIDIDHTDLLGNDRETIGLEKAGIMRKNRPVIVSDPVAPQSILNHAKELGADLWLAGVDFNYSGDKQQWGFAGRGKRYSGLAYPALRGANQLINASGVLAALWAMHLALPVTAQAIRMGLAQVQLPGRFQMIAGEPMLVLDVAHNAHSAAALAANLDAMGFYPRTFAIFGAMSDKDIDAMFDHLSHLIDDWYFCDLPTKRALGKENLLSKWQLWIEKYAQTHSTKNPQEVKRLQSVAVQLCESPTQALELAITAANATDRIITFGSFLTVGGLLKNGIPRLNAKHIRHSS